MFRSVLEAIRDRVDGTLAVTLIGLDGIPIETINRDSVPLETMDRHGGPLEPADGLGRAIAAAIVDDEHFGVVRLA